MASDDNVRNSPRRAPPWQFGIRTLLLVTAATAVALALVVSLPSATAVPAMICLTIAIPPLLTVTLIYGSGYERTFCIGALFPTSAMLYVTGWLFALPLIERPPVGNLGSLDKWLQFFEEIGNPYRVYVGATWLLAIFLGFAAVGVRWGLEKAARGDQKGS